MRGMGVQDKRNGPAHVSHHVEEESAALCVWKRDNTELTLSPSLPERESKHKARKEMIIV